MEKYEGSIQIEFEDIPSVRLKTIIPKEGTTRMEKLALATKRRFFTLHKDWIIKFDNIAYEPRLNGKIKIPAIDDQGEKIVFDGASIPLPWLVSLLTIGILRPLGVMLIASIVHDYAFKYGHLKKEDGTVVNLERHIADRLLRDILITVNKLPEVGYIGWFFVRIGWITVKYNQKPRGGKAPILEYCLFITMLAFFITIGLVFSFKAIVFWLVTAYLAFYLTSINLIKTP